MSVPLRKRKSSNNGSVSLPSPSKRRKLYVEVRNNIEDYETR